MPALGIFDYLVSICRIHQPEELEALGRQAAGGGYRWVSGTSGYSFGGRAQYFYGLPRPD
jgi:hypothetical protein